MVRAAAALVLAAMVVLSRPAVAQEGWNDKATQLLEDARRARKESRWEDCMASATAAWALAQHPAIAGALGDCALELKRYREAATYLHRYLATPPEGASAEAIEFVRGQLDQAKTQVATVEVAVNVDGADVVVDGTPLDGDEAPVYLDPGSHTFRATHDGYETATATLDLVAGSKEKVSLELLQLAPPPPNGDIVAPDDPTSLYAAGGALLGAGAIGAVVGVVLFVVAGDKSDEGDALATSIAPDGAAICGGSSPQPECSELRSIREDRDALFGGAIGATVGGGLAAATGIALLVVASSVGSEDAASVVPFVAPGFAGLTIRGCF